MTTPNKDYTGCIDKTSKIQMECTNCPPCYKGTKKACEIIKSRTNQIIHSGK